MSIKTLFFSTFLAITKTLFAQNNTLTININSQAGHVVPLGSSGFNVRIGDKVWSYKHPDFIKAVQELRPGWLRYWSGTAGDAFSAATGMYDKEYISMFDKGEAYDRLYEFVEVKGPHRLLDLYHLMGTVGGKVVITVNAFTETPEMTAELARFCKNNHIQVEAWQFCNEPYFYVPERQRFWWNDGYDYAQKMKPHADAIRQTFPDAHLALNFTWDGIWTFMKEINQYQKERGAFWNTFSKHSYAPHTGKEETYELAYKRMNTKLLEATSPAAMQEIEQWTQKGIPMLITEFGVWNRPLNGITAAVYNAEYTLRQLAHPNTWLIGSHEISNKIKPAKNLNPQILEAFKKGENLNTLALETGIEYDDEGKAFKILHEATNNSTYIWETQITGAPKVAGMNNTQVEGMFAIAFKGIGNEDYLLITNRSDKTQNAHLLFDNKKLNGNISRKWIAGITGKEQKVDFQEDMLKNASVISIPSFSVMLLKWQNNRQAPPQYSRIYKAQIQANDIALTWTERPEATAYILSAKDIETGKIQSQELKTTHFLYKNIEKGKKYQFSIKAKNSVGESQTTETIDIKFDVPTTPTIFKLAPRDNQLTVFWNSVPNANGYKVTVQALDNSFQKKYEANNVFGYKIYDLPMNTPCKVSVSAYNGLGESTPSEALSFICKENIPLPPTNISAIENDNGAISLKWTAPKQQNTDLSRNSREGVFYRLYRGEKPHDFTVLAENIKATNFVDTTIQKGKDYFYTVKSYTADGACSFYPNVATIIRNNKKTSVWIDKIDRNTEGGYEVNVQYKNVPIDGESNLGILLSDVSYLNGEEVFFKANTVENGFFIVKIPVSALKSKTTYALKASIKTNGGTPVLSLPPHKEFKTQ